MRMSYRVLNHHSSSEEGPDEGKWTQEKFPALQSVVFSLRLREGVEENGRGGAEGGTRVGGARDTVYR
jgi:hypothetical protein